GVVADLPGAAGEKPGVIPKPTRRDGRANRPAHIRHLPVQEGLNVIGRQERQVETLRADGVEAHRMRVADLIGSAAAISSAARADQREASGCVKAFNWGGWLRRLDDR